MSDTQVISDCSHSRMIYDPENSEDICVLCGIVVLPSYGKKDQEQEEQQVEQVQEPEKPDTKGYIVPKPTKVDFSCGGFASSKIDTRNTDCVGKRVNPALFNRLRFINSYIASSAGMSTFRNGVWHISSYSDKLHIPNFVKERAAELFEKIYYFRTNIHNSKNIVCACIYYACKEASIDRTMQDIANIAEESDKYASKIFKTYQELIEDLKLDSPKNLMISDHIEHYGSRMKLKQRIIRYAIEIYRKIKYSDPQGKMYFSGKAPRITAVVLLYISASIFAKDHYEPILKYTDAADLNDYIFRKRVKEHLENDRFKLYRPYVLIV